MRVCALSDVGKTRTNNEDAYQILEDLNLFIVCDGMGGHQAGEVASQFAIDAIAERVKDAFPITQETFLDQMPLLLNEVNAKMMAFARTDEAYRNMGTTVVLCYLSKDKLYIANVGDSRCYVRRSGELVQVSRDHSLVAELLKIGSISEAEAEKHPDRNIITSALGVDEKFDIYLNTFPLEEVSHVLLCTDGLTNMVSLPQMTDAFSNISFEALCEHLVEAANASGGLDNITVMCIEI